MIALAETHEASFFSMASLQLVLEGKLQSDFYGGGAIVGKVKFIQTSGDIFYQFLAELNGGLMGKVDENNVLQLVDLLFNGCIDLGVAVT